MTWLTGPLALVAVLSFAACGSANKEWLEARAVEKWRAQGFEVVDYEGFKWCLYLGGTKGGACVWHRLRKIPDNGITYSGALHRWGDEVHVYGPSAADAIRPKAGGL